MEGKGNRDCFERNPRTSETVYPLDFTSCLDIRLPFSYIQITKRPIFIICYAELEIDGKNQLEGPYIAKPQKENPRDLLRYDLLVAWHKRALLGIRG